MADNVKTPHKVVKSNKAGNAILKEVRAMIKSRGYDIRDIASELRISGWDSGANALEGQPVAS